MIRELRRCAGLMAFCHCVDEAVATGEQRISDHFVWVDFYGTFHQSFEDEDEVVAVSGACGCAIEKVVLLCAVIIEPDMGRKQLAGKHLWLQAGLAPEQVTDFLG